MTAAGGNGDRSRLYQEFDSATKDLKFTKDFNASLEALMRDPLATYNERVMAWVKRYSWGNYRLFCVQEDGVRPRLQRDCVQELDIPKRNVSAIVKYNEKRGYLACKGKLLYPVIDPQLGPKPEKVAHSPDFLQFIETWKVAHSSDFSELEVARSTVKRIQKVILSGYKEWRTSATNGRPRPLDQEDPDPPDSTPPPVSKERESSSSAVPSVPPTLKPEEEETAAQEPIRNLPADYQTFKLLYPAKRFQEDKARPKFQALPIAEKQRVIERLKVYLASDRWKDEEGRWIPLAQNWLDSYEDDPPPLFRPSRRGDLAPEDEVLKLMKAHRGEE